MQKRDYDFSRLAAIGDIVSWHKNLKLQDPVTGEICNFSDNVLPNVGQVVGMSVSPRENWNGDPNGTIATLSVAFLDRAGQIISDTPMLSTEQTRSSVSDNVFTSGTGKASTIGQRDLETGKIVIDSNAPEERIKPLLQIP